MKRVTMQLNPDSINKAIKEIKDYKKWVNTKTSLFCKKLAQIGAAEAKVRFSDAIYSGDKDIKVKVKRTQNGWAIVAEGQAVAFIEFGAGVYYNPSEPYPEPRPEGISNIGGYGKGYGKRKAWGYYQDGDKNKLVITHGNPAAMPMWNARKEMEREITRIAKEVFKK